MNKIDIETTIKLKGDDVAIVLSSEGEVKISFPEINSEKIPNHIMTALSFSYAASNEDVLNMLYDQFIDWMSSNKTPTVCNLPCKSIH